MCDTESCGARDAESCGARDAESCGARADYEEAKAEFGASTGCIAEWMEREGLSQMQLIDMASTPEILFAALSSIPNRPQLSVIFNITRNAYSVLQKLVQAKCAAHEAQRERERSAGGLGGEHECARPRWCEALSEAALGTCGDVFTSPAFLQEAGRVLCDIPVIGFVDAKRLVEGMDLHQLAAVCAALPEESLFRRMLRTCYPRTVNISVLSGESNAAALARIAREMGEVFGEGALDRYRPRPDAKSVCSVITKLFLWDFAYELVRDAETGAITTKRGYSREDVRRRLVSIGYWLPLEERISLLAALGDKDPSARSELEKRHAAAAPAEWR